MFAGFTKDSRRLVTVCFKGPIEVWDARTGRRERVVPLKVSANGLKCAVLAPEGNRLVVAG